MTTEELLNRLNKLNVNPKYYGISGEIKENAYNIELLSDGRYAVFYLERGEKGTIKFYHSLLEANDELFKRISFNIENGLDLSK